MKIKTSRYSNKAIATSGLTPVGITQGYPRFKLPYELKATDRRLAPSRDLLAEVKSGLDHDGFTLRFRAQLDELGERVLDALRTHDRAYGNKGLVLLCYEDIRVPGQTCHRRVLAEWIEERFGIEVPELDDPATPKAPEGRPKIVRPKPRVDVELQTRLNLLPF